ncbi:hypothetical protein [Citrobacter portucalensis]|uniref:hypothetical protein n=1 Tax=Citrobacter portucalensis TaxID=1639133 RepID=UPI0023B2C5E1|nr:hypothetical protein [Citrobacter portucalensis]MDE9663099.1 hypothetical protein [Citrobacter portucalensis]MDE9672195.1 hypothetical protein [Citrobacter portucalensis]WNI84833.1 hypothetical protein RIK60_16185 [Citrobacter portucalensis]
MKNNNIIQLPIVNRTYRKSVVLYINDVAKTAETANKYAQELRAEFIELLMPAITRTDVKVAGRFTSLLNELCFMTTMTMKNTSKMGGNNDVSER